MGVYQLHIQEYTMSTKNELVEYFQGLTLPSNFLPLVSFDQEVAPDTYFSQGFEFLIDEEKFGLKTYSENTEFLNAIYEFASADGSGSSYGFWLKDGNLNLEFAPIVVFGSEGGFHIVARNFNELLQILTFDCEPMIDWDDVNYYRDPEDFEPSEKRAKYCDWLKDKCGFEVTENANTIVEVAQQEYQQLFKAWVSKFYES